MTMTPEEKVEKQIFAVLYRIKQASLLTLKGKPVRYNFTSLSDAGIYTKELHLEILFKLEELKTITVRDNPWEPPIPKDGETYLDVHQPKFNEVYEEYNNATKEEAKLVKAPLNEPSVGSSTEIVIADLESMYEEIKVETDTQKYYQKSANYGKYLIETEELQPIQAPLYKDAAQDVASYKKACDEFWGQWQVCAGDLIKKAEEAGIKDHPVSPLISQIYQLKGHLKQKPDYNDDYLSSYYLPYKELIERFEEENKTELILGDHVIETDGNKHIKLYDSYSKALDEWDKFERLRETRVWWAHYQLMRLTYGVLELKAKNLYFDNDNIIDQLYQYDFSQVAKGGNSVFIKKKDYEEWIQRVHKYLIPRLKFLERQESKKVETNDQIESTNEIQTNTVDRLKPPLDWELIKDDKKAYFKINNEVVFTFPTNWSRQFKYFKYLWDHYGEKIGYKVIYEACANLDYPKKGEIWKVNKAIRNEINKLRKKLKFLNLPIKIETARSLTLTISK